MLEPITNLGWSVETTADRLLESIANGGPATQVEPVATGFDPLDLVLEGGFRPEDLVVLGGKPGVGKTIAMLQWARAAAEACRPVAYLSYEHTAHSLLRRLLMAEIAGLANGSLDASKLVTVRRAVRAHMDGLMDLEDLCSIDPLIDQAYERLRTDGPFLSLERATPVSTGLDAIEALAAAKLSQGGLLLIDYLQKIPFDTSMNPDDVAVATTSRLKELAMAEGVAVVVASAASDSGLLRRRLQMAGLRGSSGLAHEADIAILMNEKNEAVSKVHGAYDLTLMDAYASHTVFTVEKNRDGPAPVHMQFRKEFANYRFSPRGSFVAERLVGDGLVED